MQHFDYFHREEDWFVFPLTIHPDVSGRPHMLLILEELIEYLQGFEGVEFVTMAVSDYLTVRVATLHRR